MKNNVSGFIRKQSQKTLVSQSYILKLQLDTITMETTIF